MTLHREGKVIVSTSTGLYLTFIIVGYMFFPLWLAHAWAGAWGVFLFLVIRFFRVPSRQVDVNDQHVLSACDGKVVIVEEVEETEYFNDRRLQISVFMSPLNVHINWYPVNGEVIHYKYHPGKYMVAWHPKSSVLNERTTTVIRLKDGTDILVRQIAGAVARRIVSYPKVGKNVSQNEELGFIKFGSRMDVFLPLGTPVDVKIGQKVIGSQTILAHFDK